MLIRISPVLLNLKFGFYVILHYIEIKKILFYLKKYYRIN